MSDKLLSAVMAFLEEYESVRYEKHFGTMLEDTFYDCLAPVYAAVAELQLAESLPATSSIVDSYQWDEIYRSPGFLKVAMMKQLLSQIWPDINFNRLRVIEALHGDTDFVVPLESTWGMEDGDVATVVDIERETIRLHLFNIGGQEIMWIGYGQKSNTLVFR